MDAEIQEPKDLGELYKGSSAPHKEGDRSWTRGRSPDSRLSPTDDRRETKAQREESSSSKSHSESWGEGTGWGRGEEVKDPRNSGLCSCRAGAQETQPSEASLRGHITEVLTPRSQLHRWTDPQTQNTQSTTRLSLSLPTTLLSLQDSLPLLSPTA